MSDVLDNVELLEQFLGISKSAFQVYKEILVKPPSNLTKLASHLGVSRGQLYSLLGELEKAELIHQPLHDVDGVKYVAVTPDNLLRKVKETKRALDRQATELEHHLNYLEETAQLKDRSEPAFRIIRGASTNDTLDEMILATSKPLSGFSYMYHVDACFDFDSDGNLMENEYLKVVLAVGDRFVFPGDKKSIKYVEQLLAKNPILKDKWQPRWLPKKEFDFRINFYCFGDSIAFGMGKHSEKDYLAYVLKNKEIAYSMTQLVKYMWANAKPISS